MQHDINTPAQIFRHVLASGATLTQEHADGLQALLSAFPQSGLLHAINARTGLTIDVNRAAAWFGNSDVLQKIVESPEMLPQVTLTQVIIQRLKPTATIEPEPEQAVVIGEDEAHQADSFYKLERDEDEDHINDEKDEMPGDIAGGRNFSRFRDERTGDTEKLILENLAANDYFVFDKAINNEDKHPEPTPPREEYTAPRQQPASQPTAFQSMPDEVSGVTRYHDDQLPYSFLWWLDKTRAKHSGVYQPFADPKRQYRNPPPGYYQPEAIPVQQEPVKERDKEDILDRFIEEEPEQIKPPTGDKLTADNKAKKSDEDQEELITETLARIYADQMLYSKAIAAYKILMLKNPEKRRYFADQVELLEKKIN